MMVLLAPLAAAGPAEPVGEDSGPRHWAYEPLRESAIAGGDVSRDGIAHPVDHFIAKKLKAQGLQMSPQADRRTLIRRLSFDLHGLPPTPEEVQSFVTDPDPRAYEKLVDRMLASPHYGERRARHWLDIAHYADTHGFERDRRRSSAWPYRDYVIESFNRDKPYDRFLEEQIAGDVLWPAEAEAVVATGFLAAGPWDFTGQEETDSPVLKRAARALDLDDMVTQVMTAATATTVNCARCHDHKLDPISQEEYYRLLSVFVGVVRKERTVTVTDKENHAAARAEVVKEIARLEPGLDLADMVGGGDGTGTGRARQGIDARTGKAESKPLGHLDKVVPNRFSKSESRFIDGVFIPGGENGKAEIPVSSTGITIRGIPGADAKAWDLIRNGPVNSQHSPELGGINFADGDNSLIGLHANAGLTFDLAAIREASGEGAMRFTALLGYFGAAGAYHADAWVFVDGEKVAEFRGLKRAGGLQAVEIPLPVTARFLTLLSTDGGNGISHDQVGFGNPKLLSTSASLSPAQREQLAALREKKKALDERIASLRTSKVYAIVPLDKMPEIRILRRGDPESPTGDPLPPGTFAALAMLDPELGDRETDQGRRRAALAKWITDPLNPLTRRVIVNRLWHWHFGQGLVKTPSDFGAGGDRPSHPELLDWLAVELRRKNWSLKAIDRLILTSAAYRQQSRFAGDAPGVAVDAGNRLLGRQNPHRIEAEAVRDAVLAVSDKLNKQRGGPGFQDFTYREEYAPIYKYITADEPKLWRRSIYRFIVRSTPNRFMTTLDCPDPANFAPVRLTTTTALQSLALYNNDFMLRQARYLAQRLQKDAGTGATAQIKRAFALAFSREPTDEELLLAEDFVAEQGLFAFCRSLFNANEFVYVD